MKNRRELKKTRHVLQPAVQIGKSGITEGTLNEIKRQLKKNKTIKIRFLKSFSINEGRTNDILVATKAQYISQVGNVLVIHKD